MRGRGGVQGRLIAVDGCGPRIGAAAKLVAHDLRGVDARGAVSPWDASGIFTELAAAHDSGVPGPSARTLTLLYAADLAFRLRWQIRPALAEGRSVVAAPYVETAKALGIAAGLPRRWLEEIFRFAPRPDICYHVADRRGPAAGGGPTGYGERFLTAALSSLELLDPIQLRKRSADYLAALERRGICKRLPAGAAAALRSARP